MLRRVKIIPRSIWIGCYWIGGEFEMYSSSSLKFLLACVLMIAIVVSLECDALAPPYPTLQSESYS